MDYVPGVNMEVIELHRRLYRLLSECGMNHAGVEVGPERIGLVLRLEVGTSTLGYSYVECFRGHTDVFLDGSDLSEVFRMADGMAEGKYGIGLYGTLYEQKCLETK